MQIKTIATMQVEAAREDETVDQIAHRMELTGVGFMPVVNADDQPVGVITDRDLAVRVIGRGRDVTATKARDAMTTPPECVSEDMELDEAVRLMTAKQFRRLLVRAPDGRASGVLSLDDIAFFTGGDDTTGKILNRIAQSQRVLPPFALDEVPS